MAVTRLSCRSALALVLALLLGLPLGVACRTTDDGAAMLRGRRPNIVLILGGQHRSDAIAAYGSQRDETPHIDRIAGEGLLFTNAFCGNPLAGPARATILTGRHAHAHGTMRDGQALDPALPIFPAALRRSGYQTALIGTWGLGAAPRGFDHWQVLVDAGHDHDNAPAFDSPAGRTRHPGDPREVTTDLALAWLRTGRNERRPFLLVCGHEARAPTPATAPNIDRSVGRLLHWLDEDGDRARGTVVVYASGEGDRPDTDQPAVQMRLLIRWPDRLFPGRTIEAIVQDTDLAPTFLELAGAPIPTGTHGQSLLPVLAENLPPEARRTAYFHCYEPGAACYGVIDDRHRLSHYYEPQHAHWALFDRQADPDDSENVYANPAYAAIRRQLRRELLRLRASLDDATGDLGDGPFAQTAGIALARPVGNGWLLRGNSPSSYALIAAADPAPGLTRLSCTLRRVGDEPIDAGMLVIAAAAADPQQHLRAGIDVRGGRICILDHGQAVLAEAPILTKLDAAITCTLTFDPAAGRIHFSAGESAVDAACPEGFNTVAAYGYSPGAATALFSPISITRSP